jgi:hypothetical protein
MAHVGDRRAAQENLSRRGHRGLLVFSRVVCGGQSGVDRAAVDFALRFGLPYGGWVPRDGWAEDLSAPPGVLARYEGFVAIRSSDPSVGTTLNVRDSSATLVVCHGETNSPGVGATQRAALYLSRASYRSTRLTSERQNKYVRFSPHSIGLSHSTWPDPARAKARALMTRPSRCSPRISIGAARNRVT